MKAGCLLRLALCLHASTGSTLGEEFLTGERRGNGGEGISNGLDRHEQISRLSRALHPTADLRNEWLGIVYRDRGSSPRLGLF